VSGYKRGQDVIYLRGATVTSIEQVPAIFVSDSSCGRVKLRLKGRHARPHRCVGVWSIRSLLPSEVGKG
jgi:hypothetical protein